MKFKFSVIFILTLFSVACWGQNYASFEELKEDLYENTVPLMKVQELNKKIKGNQKVVVLDAREYSEYKVSHIKGAIPVGYDNFKIKPLKKIDRDVQIVVYCSVGYRSERIGEQLQKSGFTKVYNLEGGIFEWKNSGYAVYDKDNKETEDVHAFSRKWGIWLKKGNRVYE